VREEFTSVLDYTRLMRFLAGAGVVALVATAVLPACSQGQGTGSVVGVLNVPDCWTGGFNLHPNFFAALGFTNSIGVQATTAVQIRIQNGSDYEGFSDGLLISVEDAGEVRGDPLPDGTPRPSLLGKPLIVSNPPGVEPPGVPIMATANPSIVSASLYLNKTCATTNDALYALAAVALGPDGECADVPAANCGTPAEADAGTAEGGTGAGGTLPSADSGADAGSEAGGAGQVGQSTITFTSLFDGNADESNAAERLSDATFTFYLADPREECPGGLGPPPPCRGYLTGNFHFYFQRGRPAQAFP
jgi:hypothetical protein